MLNIKVMFISVLIFRYFFKGLSFTGDVTMQGGIGFRKFTTFKNLYKSIEKINEKLTTDPLPGLCFDL